MEQIEINLTVYAAQLEWYLKEELLTKLGDLISLTTWAIHDS